MYLTLIRIGVTLAIAAAVYFFATGGAMSHGLFGDASSGQLATWGAVVLVVAGLAAAVGRERLEWVGERLLAIPSAVFGAAMMLLVGAVCSAIAIEVFGAIPRVQDEINYFFQAKIFASGRLWVDSHELADFFSYRFMVNDGRFYSLFQPGWPALLAVGHLLGAPELVGPAMAAISTGLTYGVARRLLGEAQGRWATIFLASSSVFLFQGGSMMAHSAAAAFGLAMVYFAVRAREEPRPVFLVAAGAAAGYLFTIRAGTAVALAIVPAAIFAGMLARGTLRLPSLGWLALGFVPTAGLQFAYNWALSGDPMTFPQARYFELTEPIADCHRLGIGEGVGCPREHGPDLGPNGFTWARAAEVTRMRLAQFRHDLFGTGLGVVLPALAFLTSRVRREYIALLGIPLALVGLYFFYYYHGNMYGARYYFEAIPYCMMLIAAGVVGLWRDLGEIGWLPSSIARGASGLLLVGALALPTFSAALKIGGQWELYSGFWQVHHAAERTLEEADISNAVVLIPGGDRQYWTGFWRNDPTLDGEVIIAHDIGRANAQLRTYYPERSFYRFVPLPGGEGRLAPLDRLEESPELIHIEAEAKFPPIERQGGYAQPQNMRPWKRARASRGRQLFFDAKHEGAWFAFEQYVFEAGDYRLAGRLGMGPDYGIVQISVDGQALEPTFDGYSPQVRIGTWRSESTVHLEPGTHRVRLEVVGRSEESVGWVAGLDVLRFERVAGRAPESSPDRYQEK
jgi:hypothetical protein